MRGELKLGEKLPTEEELAEVYGVSRPTVRAALKSLEEKGILRPVKGARAVGLSGVAIKIGGSVPRKLYDDVVKQQ